MNEEFDIFNNPRKKDSAGFRNYDSLYTDFGENDSLYKRAEQPDSVRQVNGNEQLSWKALNRTQKIFLGCLAFVGLFALVFTVLQFRGILYLPFPSFASDQFSKDQSGQAEDLNALNTKDTDNDKLTDYQELYVYKTSPYIADSDSDGTNDYDELAAGSNPNCPKGKNCFDPSSGFAGADSVSSTSALDSSSIAKPQTLTDNSQADFLAGKLTPEQIKTFLKQQGATDDMLSQISDEDLQSMYLEALGQAKSDYDNNPNNTYSTSEIENFVGANSGASTDSTASTGSNDSVFAQKGVDLESLKTMDAATLRKELIKLGLSESLLSQFDDKTLKQVFLDSLTQAEQKTNP